MTKQNLGGWIRHEADHLLKGWVTDRNARDERLVVDVMIDGRPAASVTADRFDPKLVELGEGDGCYAFVVAVPPAFRDDLPHTFSAEVKGAQFKLRSKAESFCISPEETPPSVAIVSAGFGAVTGRVNGWRHAGERPQIELWRGGRRLDAPVQTMWDAGKTRGGFRASFAPELCDGDEPLVLAAAGMIEAGLPGAVLRPDVELAAMHSPEGVIKVELTGELGWLEGRGAELCIYADGAGEPILARPIGPKDGSVVIEISPEQATGPLEVGLSTDRGPIPQLRLPSTPVLGRLTRNSGFQLWDSKGAVAWTVAPDVQFDRSFYAFPERVKAQQGAAGDLLHLQTELTADKPRPMLVQQLGVDMASGGRVETALLVRASRPVSIDLQIVGVPGEGMKAGRIALKRPWTWAYATDMVDLSADVPDASVVLAAHSDEGGPVEIDVAGVRLGGQSFAEPMIAPETPGERLEAVENCALTDWPQGVVFANLRGRSETASGWFVRSEGSAHAQAQFVDAESQDIGFAFAAETAANCRLEVRLDAEALKRMPDALLRFEAGAPIQARRLLNGSTAAAPEFQILDRIRVLRRQRTPSDQGYVLTDKTVAILGRKLLLTNRMHAFSLRGRLDLDAEASDFEWDDDPILEAEYFLSLEFSRPFAAAIRQLSLTAARDTSPAGPSETYLALEDRNIAEQAATTHGLKLWLAPQVVEPGVETEAADALGTIRWDWRRQPLGSIEVLVCVHNALDETLACLRSLVGTTAVPHTVQIVDDASDPGVTARIEAFIADKPWMRLARHAENQGYTASADQGMRDSTADWVILLNSDTVATPNWIEGLLEVAAADPQVAFVGPLSNAASFQSVPDVYDASNQFKVNPLPAGWSPARMATEVAARSERLFPEAPLLNGFCTLMRRSVFLDVGGMNREAFPRGYGEENDLCTRVVKAGYKLAIADHVYVYHSKSASFGSERRKELAKAGGKALRGLHPDVDYAELTAGFYNLPALVRLRAALREATDA